MPDTPLTGDVVICLEAFNSAPANSVHLCTNATGPIWKSFAKDGPLTPPFLNQYSLSFNGSSDYLSVQQNSSINISGDITLSAWVNRTATISYSAVFTKRQVGGSMNYQLTIDNSNGRVGLGHSGGAWVYNTTTTLSINTWYHVAVTVSGGTAQFYVNGTPEDSFSGISINATTHDLTIGATVGYNYFGGNIDEASIFSSALSAPQVASLIDSSGANPVPANISSFINNGLAAWYRMGDDANDTFVDGGLVSGIQDSSGSGNHATTVANSKPTFSTVVPS